MTSGLGSKFTSSGVTATGALLSTVTLTGGESSTTDFGTIAAGSAGSIDTLTITAGFNATNVKGEVTAGTISAGTIAFNSGSTGSFTVGGGTITSLSMSGRAAAAELILKSGTTSAVVSASGMEGNTAATINGSAGAVASAFALTGGPGADVITGGAGADTITGGAGSDNLVGGAGDDVFVISSAAHFTSTETIDGTSGTDTIRFSSTAADPTLTLTATVRNIDNVVIGSSAGVTTGTTALNVNAALVGNALSITGNDGANTLTGTAYADTTTGGGGADTITLGVDGASDTVKLGTTAASADSISNFLVGSSNGDILYFASAKANNVAHGAGAAVTAEVRHLWAKKGCFGLRFGIAV
ncbi:MAG: hypothetical protein EB072_21135 [Betaproteobacteria bacterium]|nr:hypothetical protein [Betaproteobacteria bacterium]